MRRWDLGLISAVLAAIGLAGAALAQTTAYSTLDFGLPREEFCDLVAHDPRIEGAERCSVRDMAGSTTRARATFLTTTIDGYGFDIDAFFWNDRLSGLYFQSQDRLFPQGEHHRAGYLYDAIASALFDIAGLDSVAPPHPLEPQNVVRSARFVTEERIMTVRLHEASDTRWITINISYRPYVTEMEEERDTVAGSDLQRNEILRIRSAFE